MGFRIREGQQLRLQTLSSAAAAVRAMAGIRYDDGTDDVLTIFQKTLSSSRVQEEYLSETRAVKDGEIVFAFIEPVTSPLRRGQVYARLNVGQSGQGPVLCQDYVYTNTWCTLGTMRDSGPAGGDGYLSIRTAKATGAPAATTTFGLAAGNTLRKILGFAWYYHASADVANRTLDVSYRAPLFRTDMTAFVDATKSDVWHATQAVLTADQEGGTVADSNRAAQNDNGTVAVDNQASAPTPFPLLVNMDDQSSLVFLCANGQAADRDTIVIFTEEWLFI